MSSMHFGNKDCTQVVLPVECDEAEVSVAEAIQTMVHSRLDEIPTADQVSCASRLSIDVKLHLKFG